MMPLQEENKKIRVPFHKLPKSGVGEDASKQYVAFIAAYKDELHCSTRVLAKASTEEMVVLKTAYTLITIKTERKKIQKKKSGEIKQYPEDKK